MKRHVPRWLVAFPLLATALLVAACGGGSSTKAAGRTVNVEMRDIAFSPGQLDVRAGETVRFVFHNAGKVAHDAFVGDTKAQDDHEMEMRQAGDMADMHHSGNGGGITVEPGKTAELTHTFQAGDNLIGCHQPGHYAAGMKVTVHSA